VDELDEQVSRHKTEWVWTKGHANHTDKITVVMSWPRERHANSAPAGSLLHFITGLKFSSVIFSG